MIAAFLLLLALAAFVGFAALVSLRRFGEEAALAIVVALLLCLASLPAWADAPSGATTVDFTPLIATGVTLLSGIVAMLGRTAVRALVAYLEHKTRMELDAHTRDYLDAALVRAIDWGTSRAEQALGAGAPTVDLRNAAVAQAAQYALERVPDALEHFGIDGDGLKAMVEARLNTLWGDLTDRPAGGAEAPSA